MSSYFKKTIVGFCFMAIAIGCHTSSPPRPQELITVPVNSPQPVIANNIQALSVPTAPTCPNNMALVEGDYCPGVVQTCLQWVDSNGSNIPPPEPGKTGRCGVWKFPSRCITPKVHKKFCIDIYEYPNVKGQRPKSWVSWYDAKALCEAQGKRLCGRSEWTFACEGPNMQPYPYGDGYHRNRQTCNFDNAMTKNIDVFRARRPNDEMSKVLDDMLHTSGDMDKCVSPFGVYDMVGNIDEWIYSEGTGPYDSGLMSGHIFGVRNACRPMTEIHGPTFSWYETGFRCCSSTSN